VKLRHLAAIALLAIAAAAAFVLTTHIDVAGLVVGFVALGIVFDSIPANLRVPFVTAEINNSKAQQSAALMPYRALLVGQKTAGGTGTANAIYKVTSVDQVIALAGRGSMLHRMAVAFFANNQYTECNIGVLADNGAGVAATGTITITGPATAAGTISLYLGGVLVSCAVANADVQNTIATNLAAAINANTDLPVTAAAATNVVTLTFRHKGLVGNQYDVRVNYQDGEATPAGLTVAHRGARRPVVPRVGASLHRRDVAVVDRERAPVAVRPDAHDRRRRVHGLE
jgi:phage tail sheath gpL-like